MGLVGGDKPIELPGPEDSSTMDESGVTFSGQQWRGGRLGLVAGECGVKCRGGRGLGSWHVCVWPWGNGDRDGAGSDPENVSMGERMRSALSGTGNARPLREYWTLPPESVGLSLGEIELLIEDEDMVPC